MGLLTLTLSDGCEERLEKAAEVLEKMTARFPEHFPGKKLACIGPVNAPVYKVNDIYRKILYIKNENYDILIQIRKMAEACLDGMEGISLQSDLLYRPNSRKGVCISAVYGLNMKKER